MQRLTAKKKSFRPLNLPGHQEKLNRKTSHRIDGTSRLLAQPGQTGAARKETNSTNNNPNITAKKRQPLICTADAKAQLSTLQLTGYAILTAPPAHISGSNSFCTELIKVTLEKCTYRQWRMSKLRFGNGFAIINRGFSTLRFTVLKSNLLR